MIIKRSKSGISDEYLIIKGLRLNQRARLFLLILIFEQVKAFLGCFAGVF